MLALIPAVRRQKLVILCESEASLEYQDSQGCSAEKLCHEKPKERGGRLGDNSIMCFLASMRT